MDGRVERPPKTADQSGAPLRRVGRTLDEGAFVVLAAGVLGVAMILRLVRAFLRGGRSLH